METSQLLRANSFVVMRAVRLSTLPTATMNRYATYNFAFGFAVVPSIQLLSPSAHRGSRRVVMMRVRMLRPRDGSRSNPRRLGYKRRAQHLAYPIQKEQT